MKRLGTPLGQPAIIWTRNRAVGVLEETEGACEGGVVCGEDRGTHDHVRVSVDVLCETVCDDVGAEDERGLVKGGQKRVVHDDEGSRRMRARQGHDSGYIHDPERRVRGGFYPDELSTVGHYSRQIEKTTYLCVGLECCQNGIIVGRLEINKRRLDALRLCRDLFQIAKRTAVDVIHAQNVRIRAHGLDQRGRRGRPRGKRDRIGTPRL